MSDIKPCFCGAVAGFSSPWSMAGGDGYRVTCARQENFRRVCWGGPWAPTHQDAIHLWNAVPRPPMCRSCALWAEYELPVGKGLCNLESPAKLTTDQGWSCIEWRPR